MFDTSKPLSSVVVSSPASASVETFGLSTMAMSGRLPAAVVRSLTVSPVLPALRLIVMPISDAQASIAFAHVDEASRSGYGSQSVYSVESAEGVPALPDDEHPVSAAALTPRAMMTAPMVRALRVVSTVFLSEGGTCSAQLCW